MVSDFRKKKLLRGFDFMDTDKNGTINKEDYDLVLKKVAKARGWQPGDAKYKETEDYLNKIWDGIQKKADSNNDGEVSADEWLALWDEYAKSPTELEFQTLNCKFMFSLQDAGNDGKIDGDEFVEVVTSFGRQNKEQALAAWQKVSKGKSVITWEDFQELWREYYVTEDPNAPGNFIFGGSS